MSASLTGRFVRTQKFYGDDPNAPTINHGDIWLNARDLAEGGGGGLGGPELIQVADEPTAVSESASDPGNIYFWVE